MNGKMIIFSAPSGSGKSTIINYLLNQNLPLSFSVSATSRAPRGEEQDGVAYHFLSPDVFKKKVAEGAFLEYEEVYKDTFYGTLKSEVQKIFDMGRHALFDIDVVGGCRLKEQYGDAALSVFIRPPSLEALQKRLEDRRTDAPEVVAKRLAKATYELGFASQFDMVITNDDLEKAQIETLNAVKRFIGL
jgi:guanylate kinase